MILAYYGKIHKQTAREIKKDRRTDASPDGTESIRQCITWEEVHAIAIEIDSDNAATKAITNPGFYMSPDPSSSSCAAVAQWDGSHDVAYGSRSDGKGKPGKGKEGKDGKGEGGPTRCLPSVYV